mgnify:CR=1 FL=1
MYRELWFQLEGNKIMEFGIQAIPGWQHLKLSKEDQFLIKTNEHRHLMLVDGKIMINEEVKAAVLLERSLVKEKAQAIQYLSDTDWVVIKRLELGTNEHQDIMDERSNKRIRLQELQELIG